MKNFCAVHAIIAYLIVIIVIVSAVCRPVARILEKGWLMKNYSSYYYCVTLLRYFQCVRTKLIQQTNASDYKL